MTQKLAIQKASDSQRTRADRPRPKVVPNIPDPPPGPPDIYVRVADNRPVVDPETCTIEKAKKHVWWKVEGHSLDSFALGGSTVFASLLFREEEGDSWIRVELGAGVPAGSYRYEIKVKGVAGKTVGKIVRR